MADAVLLLWLEAPLQSWGNRARWDVRDTGLEPTKSGVIGLFGCALGLCRDDPELEKLDTELRFGVRIDRPGIVATDYHTVTGYHRTAAGAFKLQRNATARSLDKELSLPSGRRKGPATVVSQRDYLHDAVFLAAVAGEAGRIETLRHALAAPKWPLYLGRKSCPPTRPPLDDHPQSFPALEAALEQRPRHPRAREGKLQAYIEDPAGSHVRQDALRINRLRMYEFRNCHFLEVDPPCTSQD